MDDKHLENHSMEHIPEEEVVHTGHQSDTFAEEQRMQTVGISAGLAAEQEVAVPDLLERTLVPDPGKYFGWTPQAEAWGRLAGWCAAQAVDTEPGQQVIAAAGSQLHAVHHRLA